MPYCGLANSTFFLQEIFVASQQVPAIFTAQKSCSLPLFTTYVQSVHTAILRNG